MSAGSFLRSLKDRYPNKLLYFPPSYHTDVRIRTAHPEPERQTDFRVAEPSLLEEEQTIVRRRCLFSKYRSCTFFTRHRHDHFVIRILEAGKLAAEA